MAVGTGGAGSAAVAVEVLVHVEDEVRRAAIQVGDVGQCGRRAVRDQGRCVRPVIAGQEDHVGCGARVADGGHGGLYGCRPSRERCKIVGFVHQGKGDVGAVLVLGCQLRPERGKLGIGDGARRLPDNIAIPASIVVNTDDAKGRDIKAGLHERVVSGEVGAVQCAAKLIVYEVLPPDWQTEGIESVVRDEMVHLVHSSGAGILSARGCAGSVGAASEVKASYTPC